MNTTTVSPKATQSPARPATTRASAWMVRPLPKKLQSSAARDARVSWMRPYLEIVARFEAAEQRRAA
ncbi:hypothetical protein ACNQFN_11410 [Thauera butanivorans]|uniref:hypothetical protein n=1 Tax=Thauera butanivorans TaxID=86174 RepID=UPI003AB82332